MFDQSFECPMKKSDSQKKSEGGCEGCRKNGALKNVCVARCDAYRKYVEAKFKTC